MYMINEHIRLNLIHLLLFLIMVCSCDQSLIGIDVAHESLASDKSLSYKVDGNIINSYINCRLAGKNIKNICPFIVDADTLFYAVNFDKGWQIISSDLRTTPILAYGDSGNIDIYSSNKGLDIWIKWITSTLLRLKTDEEFYNTYDINEWADILLDSNDSTKLALLEDYEEPTKTHMWSKVLMSTTSSTIVNSSKSPLISTVWGQKSPWNNDCPLQTPVGCVAVAVGQILYYFHNTINKPNGLYHSIDASSYSANIGYGVDHSAYTYYTVNLNRNNYTNNSTRWSEMALSSVSSTTSLQYVRDLLMDVGDRVQMKYSLNNSISNIIYANQALSHYNLTGSLMDYDYSAVKYNLDYNKPIIIQAYASIYSMGQYYDGHCWIIDGYKEETTEISNTYVWLIDDTDGTYTREEVQELFADDKIDDGMISIESSTSNNRYLHMVWGDNGNYDGYYLSNTDGIWSFNTYDFQYDKDIICGIN